MYCLFHAAILARSLLKRDFNLKRFEIKRLEMYDTKKMCHITIIQKAKHLKIYVTAVQEHKNLF